MRGQPPAIHGDGEQTRDFTYVDDVVEATMLAALETKSVGEVFNVASGTEIKINELRQYIAKLTGNYTPPEYVDKRDIDNIRRRVLNIEKMRRMLRWAPTVNIYKGLEKTYEWLLAKKSGVEKRNIVSLNAKSL